MKRAGLSWPHPVMEARAVGAIPLGPHWWYEPKWDGFRCLAFRDERGVELQSKAGTSLTRYFPEIVGALEALGARRFVLDGELIVPAGDSLSFDDLLKRIHPAPSRVRKLAAETPARYVVFDLLVDERGIAWTGRTLAARRERLERFAARHLAGREAFVLSPGTADPTVARTWMASRGGMLDGVIAKRTDRAYGSGTRDAMEKVKDRRTADCVVGGFRYAEKEKVVGSLLLGLYDDAGKLHHVGFTSSLTRADRVALTPALEKLVRPPGFTGKAPGGPSRWSRGRSSEWQPLAPRKVVEVEYDHFSGGRFRHGTKFLRWRPDKAARQCTLDQLGRPPGSLAALLAPARKTRAAARTAPRSRAGAGSARP
jgi:ATP-dependent DNA ligase